MQYPMVLLEDQPVDPLWICMILEAFLPELVHEQSDSQVKCVSFVSVARVWYGYI